MDASHGLSFISVPDLCLLLSLSFKNFRPHNLVYYYYYYHHHHHHHHHHDYYRRRRRRRRRN
jgi:hypothetical protein